MKYVHGEYLITLCGEQLLTHAYGPWNRECVSAFSRDYHLEVAPLIGKRWADIVVLIGESLLIPEAESLLLSRINAAADNGLQAVALVIGRSSVKTSTRTQLERMYNQTPLPVSFFSTYQDASAWLASEGFSSSAKHAEAHFARIA
ncbi:hypothetical protein [Alteromonas sp. H39]|uniref:hypothetical protein n=1 Tax=Alteromonas sp. H39 TaxID=3389876 RepID=UPI0039DFFEE2